MQKQLAQVSQQWAALNAANVHKQGGLLSATQYREQVEALKKYRDGVEGVSAGFNEAMIASGKYNVETLKTISHTEQLTKRIREQKLTAKEYREEMKRGNQFKDVANQQAALMHASTVQWGGSSIGKQNMDMYVPKNLKGELTTARIQYGIVQNAVKSVSQQTINWGKNTQWAGRQITVGIGYPIALLGAAMGAAAFQADQQITRIQKVYDTQTVNQFADAQMQLAQTEVELSRVREMAFDKMRYSANEYGASLKETGEIMADLAAVGYSGNELMKTTNEVQRIATLGELDHQQALDMTITLMSTYNQTADDLGKTFNYINAIENATSLSTQDFAEALPRAGNALESLGVSVEEMGVLLVAMKEGGVNAAEGANALKSATTRLLNPTAAAVNAFRAMNVNIEAIVANNGGNLLGILGDIGAATAGFNEIQRQSAIAALFGTYQFNRMNVAVDNVAQGMGGTAKASSQVASAVDAMNDSLNGGSEAAATAAAELVRYQESVSGRIKVAFESIKVELAEIGQYVLMAVAPALEFVNFLLAGFNQLATPIKVIALVGAAILGVVGVLIMLTGVFATLQGYWRKGWANLSLLITGIKLQTAEEVAQQKAAEKADLQMKTQIDTTSQLTTEVQRLTEAMQRLHKEQSDLANNAPDQLVDPNSIGLDETYNDRHQTMIDYSGDPTGNDAKKPGEQLELFDDDQMENTDKARNNMAQIREDAEGAERATTGIGTKLLGLAVAVPMFMDMSDSTNSMLANVIEIGILMGALNMTGIFAWGKAGGGMFKSMSTAIKGMFATAMGAAKKFAVFLKGLNAPLTIMLTLLAGVVAFLVQAEAKAHKLEDRQKKINESAKAWGDILGFQIAEQKTLADGTVVNTREKELELVDAMVEANGDLTDSLNEAAEAAKESGDASRLYSLALDEALKVRMAGGSEAQAGMAFKTSLQASGIDQQTMDQLLLDFKSVDLSNPDAIKSAVEAQLNNVFSSMEVDAGNIGVTGITGWYTSSVLPALGFGSDYVNDEVQAEFARVTGLFANAFNSADSEMAENDVAMTFLENMNETFDSQLGDLTRDLPGLFENRGIDTADKAYQAYAKAWESRESGEILTEWEKEMLNNGDYTQFYEQYGEILGGVFDGLGASFRIPQETVDQWKEDGRSLTYVLDEVGAGSMRTTDAADLYAKGLEDNKAEMAGWTEEQKLAYLNTWRMIGGLGRANDSTVGFTDVLGDAALGAEGLGIALSGLSKISLDGLSADEYTGFLKDKYSGAMQVAYDLANDISQQQKQAEMDGLRDANEARQKALEDRIESTEAMYDAEEEALEDAIDAETKALEDAWDAREDALEDEKEAIEDFTDAKIEAIEAEIDALEDADELRQKLFEREKARIERLAEVENAGIDFNTALMGGDLGEAAKVRNSIAAKQMVWSLEDQQDAMDDAHKGRVDGLRGQIDTIEDEKQARLDALDEEKDKLQEVREFEEEQLKLRQDALKEDLENRKRIALDGLQNEKDRLAQDLDANIAAAEARWKYREWSLGMELDAIRASTPRNQEEYDNQVRLIEEAYSRHGVELVGTDGMGGMAGGWHDALATGMFNKTAEATNKLRDNIAWEELGNVIQQQIDKGTGVSMRHLEHFLSTGRWPVEKTVGGQTGQGGMRKVWVDPDTNEMIPRHSGGLAPTWSQAERVGVPRSAGQYPSEVPTLLKQGEFVVNANATRNNLDLLRTINSHHAGGVVGRQGLKGGKKSNGAMHTGGMASGLGVGTLGKLMAAMNMIVPRLVMQSVTGMGGVGQGFTAGPMGGGGSNGEFTTSNRNFPRAIQGVVSANTKAAVAMVKRSFPAIKSVGTLGSRPNKSDHPMGKALDAMIPNYKSPAGIALGNQIADMFIKNPNAFGTKYVIWRDKIAQADGKGWKRYTHPTGGNNDTLAHRDHVHASLFHQGGMVNQLKENLPQLRTGGAVKYDNTLANLHKGETVLTSGLTNAMKELLVNGTNNEYNVVVDLQGSIIQGDVDIEKAVQRAMDKAASKNGRKRVIS